MISVPFWGKNLSRPSALDKGVQNLSIMRDTQ